MKVEFLNTSGVKKTFSVTLTAVHQNFTFDLTGFTLPMGAINLVSDELGTTDYVVSAKKLSAYPENEQCGWLKDKYGVSWQIVPTVMNDMMGKGTKEQQERVTQTFLKMKKFDIATLQKAFEGKKK